MAVWNFIARVACMVSHSALEGASYQERVGTQSSLSFQVCARQHDLAGYLRPFPLGSQYIQSIQSLH